VSLSRSPQSTPNLGSGARPSRAELKVRLTKLRQLEVLTCGECECVMLLDWYERRFTRVFPEQKKLAAALKVKVRQLRNYLRTLRRLGIASSHQGGNGRAASYALNLRALIAVDYQADCRADCQADCRAEMAGVRADLAVSQQVAGEDCRAELEQLKSSSCSLGSFDQSESTVQEHRKPNVSAIEPSPFEKAQADAIANSVRACGFEPTSDLIAKLERKRRHYGVKGFRVASEIDRAFKLVEGTSNHPQGPGWILAVVENALKPSERDKTERRSVAGETPATYRPKWTPRPIPAADFDQADGATVATTRATEEKRRQFQSMTSNMSPPTAPACLRCGSDGVVNGTVSWCDCERGREQRRARPGYVDYLIRKGWKPGAIAAAVQPRPPQSEPGPLRDVATAAGGAR